MKNICLLILIFCIDQPIAAMDISTYQSKKRQHDFELPQAKRTKFNHEIQSNGGKYIPKEVQATIAQFMIKDVFKYILEKGEVVCSIVCGPDEKPGLLYQDKEIKIEVVRGDFNLLECAIFINGKKILSPVLPMKGSWSSNGSYPKDYRVRTVCDELELRVQVRCKKNTQKLLHWLKYNLLIEQAAVINTIFSKKDFKIIQLSPQELTILSTIPSDIGAILLNCLCSDTFFTSFWERSELEEQELEQCMQQDEKRCCDCIIL